MKRILPIILSLLLIGCSKSMLTFNESLSEFLSTRSQEPLESTIWEHKTGDEYNRYILFQDGYASLFYGLVEDGEPHRYTPYYSAPYTYADGVLSTSITYPLWGKDELTESASVVQAGDSYTLYVDGNPYYFLTTDTSSLDDMWMTITVNIKPWE